MDKSEFLSLNDITEDALTATGLDWTVLHDIANDYASKTALLDSAKQFIMSSLQGLPKVHSVRGRVKASDHLVRKIVRKLQPSRDGTGSKYLGISKDSYLRLVTDTVGVRALHLYKEDWRSIHEFITDTWDLAETPMANVRAGDPRTLVDEFVRAGCSVNIHRSGYRSIHYVVKTRLVKGELPVEVQVRTLIEEAWSEIDHDVRYPGGCEEQVANLLAIFSGLAGSADEIGSYVKHLQANLRSQATAKAKAVAELEHLLTQTNADRRVRDEMATQIRKLEAKVATSGLLTGVGIALGAVIAVANSGRTLDAPPPSPVPPDTIVVDNEVDDSNLPNEADLGKKPR